MPSTQMIIGTAPFQIIDRAMKETSTAEITWTALAIAGVNIWNVVVKRCRKSSRTMHTMFRVSNFDWFRRNHKCILPRMLLCDGAENPAAMAV